VALRNSSIFDDAGEGAEMAREAVTATTIGHRARG